MFIETSVPKFLIFQRRGPHYCALGQLKAALLKNKRWVKPVAAFSRSVKQTAFKTTLDSPQSD